MALARFVVTARVTETPDAQGKYGLPGMPLTFLPGQVIYADSAARFATAPQLVYQAIGAGNLRPFADGQDSVGHAALSN